MNAFTNKEYPELEFFMNEDECDVVFVVDGERVPAHKVFMRAKSPVFNAMFSKHFKESNEKIIEIKDTTFNAFKAMVLFIYTDLFAIADKTDIRYVCDILKLADRYQLLRLSHRIVSHYNKKITFENFDNILVIAFEFQIQELITNLKAFMKNNFNYFIAKDMSVLKRINALSDNSLLELLVTKWSDRDTKSNPKKTVFTSENLFRKILYDEKKFF